VGGDQRPTEGDSRLRGCLRMVQLMPLPFENPYRLLPRLSLLLCVCAVSVHSVGQQGGTVQSSAVSDGEHALPACGERQLPCQLHSVGRLHRAPPYVTPLSTFITTLKK